MPAPKTSDILKIVRRHFPEGAHSLYRFPAGLAHYVYDVATKDGEHIVVRVADPQGYNGLPGGVYWHARLKPLGLPLPELLAHDLQAPFPYMILERLPGNDLGQVYPRLSTSEKQRLARKVAAIQDQVAELAPAASFGWLSSYQPADPIASWQQVVAMQLDADLERIAQAGLFDPDRAGRISEKVSPFVPYLQAVAPRPFLDDTTTKNVLIHRGRLSGIVDTDTVCFGDRLYVLALTRLALLADEMQTDYIDYWAQAWKLSGEQKKAVDLYTAIHCVGFMAETGQTFNRRGPAPIDPQRVERLEAIFNELLDALA